METCNFSFLITLHTYITIYYITTYNLHITTTHSLTCVGMHCGNTSVQLYVSLISQLYSVFQSLLCRTETLTRQLSRHVPVAFTLYSADLLAVLSDAS